MGMTNAAHRIEIHPFAGFGPAPYRVVNVTEKLFAIPGEAARPCGCCDVCMQTIRWAFTVRASNGVEFVTGCDCALKAGMTLQEIKEARRGYRNARLAAERAVATRETAFASAVTGSACIPPSVAATSSRASLPTSRTVNATASASVRPSASPRPHEQSSAGS